MRINYCEDEDFPNQAELWLANVERSLKGKKGQAALREIEAALLSMPEKRLIAGALENEAGDVCAIAALAKHKDKPIPEPINEDDAWDDENAIQEQTMGFGVEMGLPRLVAFKVVEVNDNASCRFYGGGRAECSPEERYTKVLAWVQRKIST